MRMQMCIRDRDETDVNLFKNGVDIGEEKLARPADLVILGCKADVSEITLTITEGKFHQVKRMFEAVGKKVLYLKRISMGPLLSLIHIWHQILLFPELLVHILIGLHKPLVHLHARFAHLL